MGTAHTYGFLPLRRLRVVGVWVVIWCVGIGCGAAVDRWYVTKTLRRQDAARQMGRLGQTGLVSPLLYCEANERVHSPSLRALETILQQASEDAMAKKSASAVSIYVRLLDTGQWTGVNEDATFASASLIKLPYLLAYDKRAETDPGIVSDTLVYDGSFNEVQSQNIPPEEAVQVGKTYTVAELLDRMIRFSENNAAVMLIQHIGAASIEPIFHDLRIPLVLNPVDQSLLLSPKEYSKFFRVLYNGTYLNTNASEQALHMLSNVRFMDGLVAGLPHDIVVAHKFGEHSSPRSSGGLGPVELHDCGIVYHPQRPYFICVMTRGHDFSVLQETIRKISSDVYTFIDTKADVASSS